MKIEVLLRVKNKWVSHWFFPWELLQKINGKWVELAEEPKKLKKATKSWKTALPPVYGKPWKMRKGPEVCLERPVPEKYINPKAPNATFVRGGLPGLGK
jgi:hypothetical protein